MDRTACIDLPAFPLQLLLLKHPDWRTHPAAVVEADTPQVEQLVALHVADGAPVADFRHGQPA